MPIRKEDKRKAFYSLSSGKTIVGEFSNENNEEFCVYTFPNDYRFYVTGDEMDWEVGWYISPNNRLCQDLLLTDAEVRAIKDVIKAIPDEHIQ